METVHQNGVCEFTFMSNVSYADLWYEVLFDVLFNGPDGRQVTVPGFWTGGNIFKVRFSSPQVGAYTYQTICSDPTNADLHDRAGRANRCRRYRDPQPRPRACPLSQTRAGGSGGTPGDRGG